MNFSPPCKKCNGTVYFKIGRVRLKDGIKQNYKCKTCGTARLDSEYISTAVTDEPVREEQKSSVTNPELLEKLKNSRKIVVSSVIEEFSVNRKFVKSLEVYCAENDATLLIIPIKYRGITTPDASWSRGIEQYLFDKTHFVADNLKIIGDVKILPTAVNPLTGLSPVTRDITTIVGHPQLQMETVPTLSRYPAILTSTGTISDVGDYSKSLAGYKAEFHHSLSAIVVELDNDLFHLRQLCADANGEFFDIDGQYTPTMHIPLEEGDVAGLVTGDEHVMFMDQDVANCTYHNIDSIVNTLKPKTIVRHDILDCYTISHHHKHVMSKYKKWLKGEDDINLEVRKTIEFVLNTTPDGCESLIVDSNHNNHLHRWLNEYENTDHVNAKFFHWLTWRYLHLLDESDGKEEPNPLQICFDDVARGSDKYQFVKKNDRKFIKDILVTLHGDIGPNGARGNRKNLSQIGDKSVIGHSHSPGINKGCWQVGTSSKKDLEYVNGPSSWMHTHCLIYRTGKRQLLSVIEGRWRA